MWMVFGLVTLACATAVLAWRNRYARWRGTWADGYRFDVARARNGHAHRVRIGLPVASTLAFECRRETALDRFFKWTGLSVEQQLGRRGFDASLYLIADDVRVPPVLRASGVADAVLGLFEARMPGDVRVRAFACRGRQLTVVFAPAREPDVDALAKAVLPNLQAIASALPPGLAEARDPLLARSIALLAMSSALAINGVVQAMRTIALPWPVTLDTAAMWRLGVVVGAALLGLLVLAAVRLLGRTSRLHVVLLELLLVGGLGAIATGVALVRDANVDLDYSPPRQLEATVADTRISYGRRGRRSYHVVFAPADGEPVRVRVSRRDHDRAVIGAPATLVRREGALGIAWLERAEF